MSSHMAAVLKAMNGFEKGKSTVSDASIENGIKLANGDKNVPLSQPSVDAVRVPDARQLTEAANNAVNLGTIQEDINKLRTLGRSSGLTDDQINSQIEDIRFGAQMKGITEQIKNSSQALYGLDGNPNPGAVPTCGNVSARSRRARNTAMPGASNRFSTHSREPSARLSSRPSCGPARFRSTTSAPPYRPPGR
jgi:hypothetical protein